MARVELSAAAVDDLERLILTHSLPTDTKARVARSLRPLERFPLLGASLEGRWADFRLVLGPWRWMVIVYAFQEAEDRAIVVTMQDGRSARSPTGSA